MIFFRLILIAAIAYAAYELLKFLLPDSKNKIHKKSSTRINKDIGIDEEDIRDADFHDIEDEPDK